MQFMIKPPLVEPVSLDEVKKWLKIETQDEDEILLTLIISARLYIEQVTQSLLIKQSWKVIFTRFDEKGRFPIPLSPVLDLLELNLRYPDDTLQNLSLINVHADKQNDQSYLLMPAQYRALLSEEARFELDVSLGYGAAALDVPAPLRTAHLMLISFWYENRGDYSTHVNMSLIPSTITAILSSFKSVRLA
jgi:uncharacterized phiE125 gp8 family phage protein